VSADRRPLVAGPGPCLRRSRWPVFGQQSFQEVPFSMQGTCIGKRRLVLAYEVEFDVEEEVSTPSAAFYQLISSMFSPPPSSSKVLPLSLHSTFFFVERLPCNRLIRRELAIIWKVLLIHVLFCHRWVNLADNNASSTAVSQLHVSKNWIHVVSLLNVP